MTREQREKRKAYMRVYMPMYKKTHPEYVKRQKELVRRRTLQKLSERFSVTKSRFVCRKCGGSFVSKIRAKRHSCTNRWF